MSEPRSVRWLDGDALDKHIAELPTRPLGVRPEDERLRLSLAGVQRKAVLVRDGDGRFGEPLNGMPSTHILKPDLPGSEYPAIAVNEYFCMRLAAVCRLPTAEVELLTIAGRPCLVVTRFDRDTSVDPARRLHQEDLCQALGITPDFKYQQADWRLPSFKALADLLDAHGTEPGRDRLAVADGAVFNVLIGNSDAHAKNMSLLHQDGGRVRLAPFYDLVSTAAYPQLRTELGLAIGDELEPDAIGAMEWDNFAADVGLGARAFARRRAVLAATVARAARAVRDEARAEGWHDPVVDTIVDVIDRRVEVVTAR
jgi:serine/threonine-protein kinase HipA